MEPKIEMNPMQVLQKPFEHGFTREIVMSYQMNNRFRVVIYYRSPEGKRLRASTDIKSYIVQKGLSGVLGEKNFSFSQNPIASPEFEKYEKKMWATVHKKKENGSPGSSGPECTPTKPNSPKAKVKSTTGSHSMSSVSTSRAMASGIKTEDGQQVVPSVAQVSKSVNMSSPIATSTPPSVATDSSMENNFEIKAEIKEEQSTFLTADQIAMMAAYGVKVEEVKPQIEQLMQSCSSSNVPLPVGYIGQSAVPGSSTTNVQSDAESSAAEPPPIQRVLSNADARTSGLINITPVPLDNGDVVTENVALPTTAQKPTSPLGTNASQTASVTSTLKTSDGGIQSPIVPKVSASGVYIDVADDPYVNTGNLAGSWGKETKAKQPVSLAGEKSLTDTPKTVTKYVCEYCSRDFTSKTQLRCHKVDIHSIFVCDCGQQCKSQASMDIHTTTCLANKTTSTATSMSVASDKTATASDKKKSSSSSAIENGSSLSSDKIVDESSEDGEDDDAEQDNDVEDDKNKCKLCNKTFTSEFAHRRHMLNIHKIGEPFSCSNCKKKFFNHPKFMAHQSDCKITQVKSIQEENACRVCGKVLTTITGLKKHIKMVHSNLLCRHCDKCFTTTDKLNKHITSKHQVEEPNRCRCGATFANIGNLGRHRKTACKLSQKDDTSKSSTPKGSTQKDATSKHSNSKESTPTKHAEEKKKILKKTASQSQAHQKDFAPGVCSICNKKTGNAFNLRVHKLCIHGVGQKFLCVCGEKFNTPIALGMHKRNCNKFKEKEKKADGRCKCVCGKNYVHNYHMKRHQKTCKKFQKTKQSQTTLGKIPSPKKQSTQGVHGCKVCNMKFVFEDSLTQHLWAVHNIGKALECEKCSQQFRWPRSLEAHHAVCPKKDKEVTPKNDKKTEQKLNDQKKSDEKNDRRKEKMKPKERTVSSKEKKLTELLDSASKTWGPNSPQDVSNTLKPRKAALEGKEKIRAAVSGDRENSTNTRSSRASSRAPDEKHKKRDEAKKLVSYKELDVSDFEELDDSDNDMDWQPSGGPNGQKTDADDNNDDMNDDIDNDDDISDDNSTSKPSKSDKTIKFDKTSTPSISPKASESIKTDYDIKPAIQSSIKTDNNTKLNQQELKKHLNTASLLEGLSLDTSQGKINLSKLCMKPVVITKKINKQEMKHWTPVLKDSEIDNKDNKNKSKSMPATSQKKDASKSRHHRAVPKSITVESEEDEFKIVEKTETVTLGEKEQKVQLPVSLNKSINKCSNPELRTLYLGTTGGKTEWLRVVGKTTDSFVYQCYYCDESREQPKLIAAHMAKEHESLKNTVGVNVDKGKGGNWFMSCRHCNYVAMQRSIIWYHMQKEHGIKNILLPQAAPENFVVHKKSLNTFDQKSKFFCPIERCDYGVHQAQMIIDHLYKCHRYSEYIKEGFVHVHKARINPSGSVDVASKDEIYLCIMCQFIAFRPFLMEMHCIETHSQKFLLHVCDTCGEQFVANFTMNLTKHMDKKHSTNKIKVSITVIDANGEEDEALNDIPRPKRKKPAESQQEKPRSDEPKPPPAKKYKSAAAVKAAAAATEETKKKSSEETAEKPSKTSAKKKARSVKQIEKDNKTETTDNQKKDPLLELTRKLLKKADSKGKSKCKEEEASKEKEDSSSDEDEAKTERKSSRKSASKYVVTASIKDNNKPKNACKTKTKSNSSSSNRTNSNSFNVEMKDSISKQQSKISVGSNSTSKDKLRKSNITNAIEGSKSDCNDSTSSIMSSSSMKGDTSNINDDNISDIIMKDSSKSDVSITTIEVNNTVELLENGTDDNESDDDLPSPRSPTPPNSVGGTPPLLDKMGTSPQRLDKISSSPQILKDNAGSPHELVKKETERKRSPCRSPPRLSHKKLVPSKKMKLRPEEGLVLLPRKKPPEETTLLSMDSEGKQGNLTDETKDVFDDKYSPYPDVQSTTNKAELPETIAAAESVLTAVPSSVINISDSDSDQDIMVVSIEPAKNPSRCKKTDAENNQQNDNSIDESYSELEVSSSSLENSHGVALCASLTKSQSPIVAGDDENSHIAALSASPKNNQSQIVAGNDENSLIAALSVSQTSNQLQIVAGNDEKSHIAALSALPTSNHSQLVVGNDENSHIVALSASPTSNQSQIVTGNNENSHSVSLSASPTSYQSQIVAMDDNASKFLVSPSPHIETNNSQANIPQSAPDSKISSNKLPVKEIFKTKPGYKEKSQNNSESIALFKSQIELSSIAKKSTTTVKRVVMSVPPMVNPNMTIISTTASKLTRSLPVQQTSVLPVSPLNKRYVSIAPAIQSGYSEQSVANSGEELTTLATNVSKTTNVQCNLNTSMQQIMCNKLPVNVQTNNGTTNTSTSLVTGNVNASSVSEPKKVTLEGLFLVNFPPGGSMDNIQIQSVVPQVQKSDKSGLTSLKLVPKADKQTFNRSIIQPTSQKQKEHQMQSQHISSKQLLNVQSGKQFVQHSQQNLLSNATPITQLVKPMAQEKMQPLAQQIVRRQMQPLDQQQLQPKPQQLMQPHSHYLIPQPMQHELFTHLQPHAQHHVQSVARQQIQTCPQQQVVNPLDIETQNNTFIQPITIQPETTTQIQQFSLEQPQSYTSIEPIVLQPNTVIEPLTLQTTQTVQKQAVQHDASMAQSNMQMQQQNLQIQQQNFVHRPMQQPTTQMSNMQIQQQNLQMQQQHFVPKPVQQPTTRTLQQLPMQILQPLRGIQPLQGFPIQQPFQQSFFIPSTGALTSHFPINTLPNTMQVVQPQSQLSTIQAMQPLNQQVQNSTQLGQSQVGINLGKQGLRSLLMSATSLNENSTITTVTRTNDSPPLIVSSPVNAKSLLINAGVRQKLQRTFFGAFEQFVNISNNDKS